MNVDIETARENLRTQPRVNPGLSKNAVNHGHMIYANVNLIQAILAKMEQQK